LSAFGRKLVPELENWSDWSRSEHHSLLHIDGSAQALKAACPTMRGSVDSGDMVISSADLTKSYSVQWIPAWTNPDIAINNPQYYENEPRNWVPDNARPSDYGWFSSEHDDVIGLPADLFGDADFGFLVSLPALYRDTLDMNCDIILYRSVCY
jgi:hypothetical protein